jgi:preprotein translocase subunit YajC
MTVLHTLIAATTTTSSKSSGSNYTFLIFAVIAVAFYFLVIRPRSQRQRQARNQVASLEIGDSVMSVGGIKGVVVGMDATDVQVEVSPGVVLTFIRKAVNVQPASTPSAPAEDPPGVYGSEDSDEPEIDPLDRPPHIAGHDDPDERPGTGTEGR